MEPNLIAGFLRSRRRAVGLNQPALANAARVSEPAIRAWEKKGFPKDRPQTEKLWRLLDVLRIRRDALALMLDGIVPPDEFLIPITTVTHLDGAKLNPPVIWPPIPPPPDTLSITGELARMVQARAKDRGMGNADFIRSLIEDDARESVVRKGAAADKHREDEEKKRRRGK